MTNRLKRHALTAFALCLLALPTADARAQDRPAPQPEGAGGPELSPRDRNSDGPFRTNEVAQRALITYKPAADFTPEALDNDVYGAVRLRVVLTSKGAVTDIRVVKGLPDGLTLKAIDAARRVRFNPAQKDGHPVSQYAVLEYNFNIDADGDMAKIVEQPQPEYTEEARRNRVAGKVVLTVLLGRDGKVVGPVVLEGLPHGLSEKAVEAALRIKFVPAEVQGRKVTVVRKLVYNFSPD